MQNLPDLEAWAIFSRVAETGSFAKAAELLGISQPTVSKAIARLEQRLGTMLLYRTTRRLSLTPTGELLRERVVDLLANAEVFESEASALAIEPHGVIRVNAPMSFGLRYLSPLLPAFIERFPGVDVELTLTDQLIDVVAGGFDVAIRIAELDDSTLRSRRLCAVRRPLVAAPAYLERHGRPAHPRDLEHHASLTYTNMPTPEFWRFHNAASGDEYAVPVRGRIRSNNADAIVPALIAGHGLALQPEFLVWEALQRGELEHVMRDWAIADIDVHLLTPPGMLRTARVTALLDYLVEHLAHAPWAMSER
ncbi:LysR substrate-binding domain-containing protein [Paraburkholderia silviterrae]|uniref:LysR family transcriptional regulator n=1 Tax=Paraburkholderia silviterrae TaxID=2528715 RepID=A0A4V2ZYK8_9BURK|nr:LysR family transcriptional regulator [Paraburkholderia silviterrae]TDG20910.1 LysR family transcriptional regulator [Paraburkholderia silviterrae]